MEEVSMSLTNHIIELEKRHHAMEKQIEAESQSLATSDFRIVEMKRKKLYLKDEIQKLKNGQSREALSQTA
jgi:hypothetical protein